VGFLLFFLSGLFIKTRVFFFGSGFLTTTLVWSVGITLAFPVEFASGQMLGCSFH